MATIIFFLNGCPSVLSPKDWADSWVGEKEDRLQKIDSVKNKSVVLMNKDGSKVVIVPTSETCDVYFNINKEGVVTSYQLIGEDCR